VEEENLWTKKRTNPDSPRKQLSKWTWWIL